MPLLITVHEEEDILRDISRALPEFGIKL